MIFLRLPGGPRTDSRPDPDSAGTARRPRLLRITLLGVGLGVVAMLSMLGAADANAPLGGRAGLGKVATASRPSPPPADGAALRQGPRMSPAARMKEAVRQARLAGKPRKRRGGRLACPPSSVICLENQLPGSPPSQWDIVGAGDAGIQGYATQISVNKGQTVAFKVNTPATSYELDIYRIGYYQGNGARRIATVTPSAALPQTQPACLSDTTTGLVDCGNWAVSASWAVPADVVSGVYIAKLVRTDGTAGASQIVFVVRDDARNSDILVQTSDATWTAYNAYGGNSLYTGNPAGRAFKVSYNRPNTSRCCSCCQGSMESWFFNAEYPMIRWLENNGYDVSYTTNVDTASRGALIQNHKLFMSSGHDEYWSNEMRTNVENARTAGINLSFFSGNEMFWKTRWENSIDGSGTPFRTLVCYKETLANAKIDPSPQWTGTWRDTRFSPPSDGGRPENAVTGTLFRMNGVLSDTMTVPSDFSAMRLWRNTAVAQLQPGQVVTFPQGVLGYEWDEAPADATAPAGLARFSRTTRSTTTQYLLDFGGTYGAGTATHALALYRGSGGGMTFGAGTVQWSWGLDAVHDRAGTPTNQSMQQATVNLFADMLIQPASLQTDLVPAIPSTDTGPPTTTITTPLTNANLQAGTPVTISGTATDTGGGVVAGVEVSTDGGVTWGAATGLGPWQYAWTPTVPGPVTIQVRAVDDIGVLQPTPATVTVNVVQSCPCTIWPPTTQPAIASAPDAQPVELGVKFRAAAAGTIKGIRFFKGPSNTGTHTGNLWTSTGQLLATATFTGETATGWQEVDFSVPVPVNPNTTYIASYFAPNGGYALNTFYFTQSVVNPPLTALADGLDGGNGVYNYGPVSTFPTSTHTSNNYWVDVLFTPYSSLWTNAATPAQPDVNETDPVVLGVRFQATTTGTIRGVRFYKSAGNTGTHIGSLWSNTGTLLASGTFAGETASGWQQLNFTTPVSITAGTTYVASYTTGGHWSRNLQYFTAPYSSPPLVAPDTVSANGNGVYVYSATNAFPSNSYQATNYWVDVVFAPSASLWDNSTLPAEPDVNEANPVVLGVKFRSTTNGTIRGVRFYKSANNTGTHIGSLWSNTGTLLASGTFTNETASGWQQMSFTTPVSITAGTTYVASYTTGGHWSRTLNYFTATYTNNPLVAPDTVSVNGNGVYVYGAGNAFPTNSARASNYWADVLFDAGQSSAALRAKRMGNHGTRVRPGHDGPGRMRRPSDISPGHHRFGRVRRPLNVRTATTGGALLW
ncbi:hypothetical protein GCM10009677_28650 [Sphaerisporangium rubeum]|uniref:DUF4082 domain-containing protein n=1 Tax=Sphaerisporangium rubeum TaxID=321317 RepID=A0A7X0IEB6_9ACTN|nr:DUF4082 domain-containing protein [Sphaerisporangium rubeum]MBB6472974.1 hypothetical protein [Sphaerisporangium rubeum]